MFPTLSPSQLEKQLSTGAKWITVNQRLARFRLQQFEATQIKQGKAAWRTPDIKSWSIWLQNQWFEQEHGLLLTPQQEALFWRDVVANDAQTSVLQPKSLAKQAMGAWQILADYFIDPVCLQTGGDEHQALWRWANEVATRIQQNNPNFVQRHQLLATLCEKKAMLSTSTLVLDGFDALNPAQIQYLQHIQASGFEVLQVAQDDHPTQPTLQAYHDDESELRLVCQHIRNIVAANKDKTIAVFIPDLEQRAAVVSQIFSEELAPELSLRAETELEGQFFNLSLGSVLAKQPMIQAALNLLSLTLQRDWQSQSISQLLHTPYLKAFADEQAQRAALDKSIRANNNQAISLKQLLIIIQHHEIKTPVLEEILQDFSYVLSDADRFSGRQYLSYWLHQADTLLAGFACFEGITLAHENAQLQGWKDMIHQLSGLDDFCGKLTWAEALARLQEYAYEQLFRPAPGLANIQVMGFLEASNLQFDEAFIISMDDHTWPPAAKPHPLIPVDIQVQYQTPHANSEREWDYAQTIWQNMMFVAPNIHVSYAKVREHQETQPSPLLADLQQGEETIYASQRYASILQQQQPKMMNIEDVAMPIAKDESIRGGTGILAAQSACSFQAFAKYRLKLEGLEAPSAGLNSREQGTLLHKVLEDFWQKHPSQQRLSDLIDAKILDAEIQSCISSAWRSLSRFVGQSTKALEERRLSRLIRDWLLLEAERAPFKVVEREVWRDVKLGDLVLHTKLDRVDIDANGHRIVLDYKTGESITGKALGDRPDAPQLPAYLLAEEDKGLTVDALAFAQVRYQGLGFKGFAQAPDILTGIKAFKGRAGQPEDWQELTQHWREVLNNLADEFMAGEATVTPKNTQSCTYCDFEGLCRIKT
ncbi:MAG TPA: hypothetical protein EYG66_02870 [Mariprofundaceae bacterium]|nr:hypothetical protein [Mariprofundaceae bacterium]